MTQISGAVLADGDSPIGVFDSVEEAMEEGARLAVLNTGADQPIPPRWVQESDEVWALYVEDDDDTTYRVFER